MITSSGNDIGGKKRNYDETRTEKAADVDSISINSVSTDVTVMVKNTSDITVNFSGGLSENSCDIKFDTKVINRKLLVTLNMDGNIIGGNLKINITVPSEVIFKEFAFNSKSGDLEILGKLSAKQISVNTMSGDVSGEMQFENAFVKTISGDIDMEAFGKGFTSIKLHSISGDISLELNNFGNVSMKTKTVSGDVKNRFKQKSEGYTATLDVNTVSGDIKIK